MNTLNFNDADLKANREGRLSDAQAKRFEAEADRLQGQRTYSFWAGVTVFSLAFIVMMIGTGLMFGILTTVYGSPNSGQNSSDVFSVASPLFGIMAVTFWVVIFIFVVTLAKYTLRIRSLTSAPVQAVEGTAEVVSTYSVSHRGVRTPVNKLILHSNRYSWLTFDFDSARSLSPFKNGGRYRIYYLPYAEPQALSMEELTLEIEKAKH